MAFAAIAPDCTFSPPFGPFTVRCGATQRVVKGLNWFAAKTEIVRAAVRAYLAAPTYNLPPPSTA